MSATSRTSLVRGPSKNSFNGGTCYSKEDFEIKINKETLPISTSATSGTVDERVINIGVETSFTPDGRWTAAILGAFINPFANMISGASLLTGTDVPFVASAADGQVHTIIAACVTKLPDILLSAKKTMFGSMTIKGYRGAGLGWTDASSLYTIGSGGSVSDTTWIPQAIPVQPYSAGWGTITGFTTFDTQDGWHISFNLQTEEIETDSGGKIDVTFKGLEIMAKCTPVGPTAANILAASKLQGLTGTNGMTRGYSLHNDGAGSVTPDLVITGQDGASIVTIAAANIKTAGYQFGSAKLRAGEIGFVATRKYTTGAQQALFTLASAS